MSEKIIESGIWVELDAILDTRLATIHKLMPEYPLSDLSSYHDRCLDEVPGISFETLREAYTNRDKTILANGYITPVAIMLKNMIKEILIGNLNSPYKHLPKIYLNVYPYKLTDTEKKVIERSIVTVVDKICAVEVVDMSYADLSIDFINRHISTLFMYEYYLWLEAHSVNKNFENWFNNQKATKHFLKRACPGACIIAPDLFFKKSSTGYNPEALKAMAELTEPFIGLKYVKAEMFSVLKPIIGI